MKRLGAKSHVEVKISLHVTKVWHHHGCLRQPFLEMILYPITSIHISQRIKIISPTFLTVHCLAQHLVMVPKG